MPNWTNNMLVCYKEDAEKYLVNEKGQVDFSILMPMPDSLRQEESTHSAKAIAFAKGEIGSDSIEQLLFRPNRFNDENKAAIEAAIAGEDENGRYLDPEKELRCSPSVFHVDGKDYLMETEEQVARLGRIYLDNEERYGFKTWYGWSIRNWGTKWNACRSEVYYLGDYAHIAFDTAWGTLSSLMLTKMKESFAHPFLIECVFEGEFDKVYNPVTDETCDPEDARLFMSSDCEDVVVICFGGKEEDPFDYDFSMPRDFCEEDIADLLKEAENSAKGIPVVEPV